VGIAQFGEERSFPQRKAKLKEWSAVPRDRFAAACFAAFFAFFASFADKRFFPSAPPAFAQWVTSP
jgi:hypothetical protein